ncbi:MAG: OmpA family protein, partial [Owenweeksia sp.]
FNTGAPLPSPFNTSYNEGGPSITADNTELYFTVCEDLSGYKNCDIYYSELDEFGAWTTPKSVGDHINRRDSWESQASVSANGDALYFASNRKEGQGALDIYKCVRLEDGSWSRPVNLGKTVNTPKNEKTPFIHSDSHTLYFTSDGHQGVGGFDIFFARATGDTTWEKPVNIGYPINSEKDDLGLFVSLDGQTAYFASNELRSGGGWDIYQFGLPETARPEQVALIQGTLTDENENPVKEASLEIKNLKTREVTKIRVDQETGNYARVVAVKPDQDFIVTVKKKGAAFSSKYVSASQELSKGVVKAPLEVAKLEVGKEYTLNDINFESNSFQLSAVSRSVIDEFVLFLKDNPELRADIQGHTDNVGNDQDNMNLSRNRAKTVYEYVISNGINASRVSHHGYGETRPIADNTTEEGRARNRRTVFVITSQ